MSINIPVPMSVPGDLFQFLQELCRRAMDVTTLQVNFFTTVNITNGDLKIVTAGKGIILPNRSGTAYYRLMIEDDGAISVDKL